MRTRIRGFINRVVEQKSKPLIHRVGQLNAKLPLEGTGRAPNALFMAT